MLNRSRLLRRAPSLRCRVTFLAMVKFMALTEVAKSTIHSYPPISLPMSSVGAPKRAFTVPMVEQMVRRERPMPPSAGGRPMPVCAKFVHTSEKMSTPRAAVKASMVHQPAVVKISFAVFLRETVGTPVVAVVVAVVVAMVVVTTPEASGRQSMAPRPVVVVSMVVASPHTSTWRPILGTTTLECTRHQIPITWKRHNSHHCANTIRRKTMDWRARSTCPPANQTLMPIATTEIDFLSVTLMISTTCSFQSAGTSRCG